MSKREVIEELHKSARKNFKRRRVIMKGIDDLWQGDLVDMSTYSRQNRGYNYLLTVIDAFSKKAWVIPLKNKSGLNVTEAMQKILNEGRICKNFQSDFGTDFFNEHFEALMKKYKINHYSVYTHIKACIIERFNRTLKSAMWKEFSMNGSYRWIDMIYELCHTYNNTIHRTIKMKPSDVNSANEANLLKNVYNFREQSDVSRKFQVGDSVRISKYKHMFEKGYTPNWTSEIFKISSIQYTHPWTYLLKDTLDKPIKGGFYEYELQKVKHPDICLIEKILKTKGTQVYVKWLGHSAEHNSWIDKTSFC